MIDGAVLEAAEIVFGQVKIAPMGHDGINVHSMRCVEILAVDILLDLFPLFIVTDEHGFKEPVRMSEPRCDAVEKAAGVGILELFYDVCNVTAGIIGPNVLPESAVLFQEMALPDGHQCRTAHTGTASQKMHLPLPFGKVFLDHFGRRVRDLEEGPFHGYEMAGQCCCRYPQCQQKRKTKSNTPHHKNTPFRCVDDILIWNDCCKEEPSRFL